MYGTVYLLLYILTNLQPLIGLSNVQICLHSYCAIVLDVFFLLLLCFYIVYSRHVSTVLLWTPVSARILALVLQLYERNKL